MSLRMMHLLAATGLTLGLVGCGAQGESGSAPQLKTSTPSLSISAEEPMELPTFVRQPPEITLPPTTSDIEKSEASPKTIAGSIGHALRTGISAGLAPSGKE